MSSDTLDRPVLKKFRLIKRAGQAVGPHVDFARTPEGEIIRGKPYREGGEQMPGDPVERQYYPGDELFSEADLDKEMNGTNGGFSSCKFERVYDDVDRPVAKMEMTVEEAKKFLEAQGAKVEMPSTPAQSVADAAKAGADNLKQQNVQGRLVRKDLLETKSFKDLQDMAKAERIDVRNAKNKPELIEVILAALNG